jgi:hypothetical protein
MAMGMVQAFFYQQKLTRGEVEICSPRGSTGGVFSISGLSAFVCRLYSEPQPKERNDTMIARFDPRPEDLQRLRVGPIGPHLPSFAALVSQQGYCSVTGWLKVRLVTKLSRWLQQHRVPFSELNETQIAAFLNARWKRLKRHVGDQTTMALLLRHLRQANFIGFWPP